MATETENYSRVITTVMTCSKVLMRVLLKRVRDLTPENHEPNPWTLDHFLDKNRSDISKNKKGKKKMHIYLPGWGKETDLSLWDLQMFCFILSLMFSQKDQNRLGIVTLEQLRNTLCHKRDPKLINGEYEHYMDVVQNGLAAQFDFIGDEDFKKECEQEFESIKKGTVTFDTALVVLHQWYVKEREVEERLTNLEEGIKLN